MNAELHKAIRSAIRVGDVATVNSLLDSVPEAVSMVTPFGTWLHVAASFGQIDIVKLLIGKYQLDINARGGVAGGFGNGGKYCIKDSNIGARLGKAEQIALRNFSTMPITTLMTIFHTELVGLDGLLFGTLFEVLGALLD